MRILYLCHRIPYPPDKGEKIRAYHQLQALSKRHEVDLFTLADDPADLESGPAALASICRRVFVAPLNRRLARLSSLPYLFTATPLSIPYFGSARLRLQIRQALANDAYDRVFVYCSSMAQYVEGIRHIPRVIDLVDVDSDKWAQYAVSANFPMSAIYRREARALRAYERRICGSAAAIVVTTDREARLLRATAPAAPVHVIPNGVDTRRFQPAPARDEDVIGFVGDMSYLPNQEAVIYFAREVLPIIRRFAPAARFLIVGRNPGAQVRALAADPGVEVTGMVPDVRPHLARMRVSVAPFAIASGIQNKILEALACEIPVVASSRATQGLTPAAASAVQTADTPAEMAALIVRLLGDPLLAREKGREGRRSVLADYDWDSALGRLLEIIERQRAAPLSARPARRT